MRAHNPFTPLGILLFRTSLHLSSLSRSLSFTHTHSHTQTHTHLHTCTHTSPLSLRFFVSSCAPLSPWLCSQSQGAPLTEIIHLSIWGTHTHFYYFFNLFFFCTHHSTSDIDTEEILMTSLTCNMLLCLALPTPGHEIRQDAFLETSTQMKTKEKRGEITRHALSLNTHTQKCQKVSYQVIKKCKMACYFSTSLTLVTLFLLCFGIFFGSYFFYNHISDFVICLYWAGNSKNHENQSKQRWLEMCFSIIYKHISYFSRSLEI